MSISYNYSTDWINRDSQPDASPLRVIKAIDFLNEWTAIQSAFNQAAPKASPTFTGTATFEGLTSSSATVNGDLTVTGTINGGSLNTSNWDTAYSWGDHAVEGYLTTETDPTVPAHVKSITTTEKSNWNTAYGWGNHASAGYLTSFTETDPTVPTHVKNITTTDIANWQAAAGLGDWTGQGFLTSVSFADIEATSVLLSSEGWTNVDNQVVTPSAVDSRITSRTAGFITDYTVTQGDVTQHQAALSITESQISNLGSYLTDAPSDGSQYARKDGVWSPITGASGGTVTSVNATVPTGLSVSGGPITSSGTLAFSFASGYSIPTTTKQGQWDTAYADRPTTAERADWNEAHGWGDHSGAGYLVATSTDKSNWNAAYTARPTTTERANWNTAYTDRPLSSERTNWNTAYNWGDHSTAGYVSSSGTGATGTWGISVTGNAATATTATNCSRSITAGTNLTGGGTLTTNRTLNLSSSLTGLTEVETSNISIGSWDIQLDGSDLRFRYNNVDVFRITTTGAIIAKDNVTAYGAP